MRPGLSYRDRAYITCLVVNVCALVVSARYWWRTEA